MMNVELLQQLVSQRKKEKGDDRVPELKVYLAYIREPNPLENTSNFRLNQLRKTDGSHYILINDVEVYSSFDGNICLFISTEESEKTKIIEKYIIENKKLGRPWVEGFVFRDKIQKFIADIGIINGYSALFDPYNEYTGYGITIRLWGSKSDEILEKIKGDYTITPKTIKAEIFGDDDSVLNFRIGNSGRISYINGDMRLFINLVKYFIEILKEIDELYDYVPIQEELTNSFHQLHFKQRFITKFLTPKGESQKLSKEAKNALLQMYTKGGKKFGFIGYSIGDNKANIVDINEKKSLYLTIFDDRISIIAKNPSEAKGALKNFHRVLTEHVCPYTSTEIENIGAL